MKDFFSKISSKNTLLTFFLILFFIFILNTGSIFAGLLTTTSTNTEGTDSLIPQTPTDLSATTGSCGSGKIYLYWKSAFNATGTRYRLYRNNTLAYEGSDLSFIDTGLLSDTSYSYKLSAFNIYGSSGVISTSTKSPGNCEDTTSNSGTSNDTKTITNEEDTSDSQIEEPPTISSTSDSNQFTSDDNITKSSIYTTPPPISIPALNPISETIKTAVFITTATEIKIFGAILEKNRDSVDHAKSEIKKILDLRISSAIKNLNSSEIAIIRDKLKSIREQVLVEVNTDLVGSITLDSERVIQIKSKINNALKEIYILSSGENILPAEINTTYLNNAEEVLHDLTIKVKQNTEDLKEYGGEYLYKDNNDDGISDYESVHVYGINPDEPSPTTIYQGQVISAGDKVLLGLDPDKLGLEKIKKEEPRASLSLTTTSYKVSVVELSEEKKLVIKGFALPNSFITIYIYSTPIIVTVKTNSDGEWEYTLDQELESGEHTIYTATVNNTGKILAKSPAYLFTKTTEAAALGALPPVEISTNENNQPGLLGGSNILIIMITFIVIFGLTLIAVGISSRNENQV